MAHNESKLSLKPNFFINLPDEINKEIFSYLYNDKISLYLTTTYVKYRGYVLRRLYLTFKHSCIKQLLHDVKEIFNFINKYSAYQSDYDRSIRCDIRNIDKDFSLENEYLYDMIECKYLEINKTKSNPILIDILNSGNNLPGSNSTMKYFHDINEPSAIYDILKLFPECIHSDFGILRCRNYITPIAAACFNKSISPTIIKKLVKDYPDFNRKIMMNGYWIEIIKDLQEESYVNTNRIEAIKDIFNEY